VNELALAPKRAVRVQAFASFFKNYMSVSSVVVASLPIPVASLHLIKTYSAQTKMFSVYTSLFCFLILGFIFFSRHSLGRIMFVDKSAPARRFLVGSLPLLLILGSFLMVFLYQNLLRNSLLVAKARELATQQGGEVSSAFFYDLDHTDSDYNVITLSRNFLSDRDAFLASEFTPDEAILNDVVIAVATRHKTSEWTAAAGQAAQDFYSHHIPLFAYIGNPRPATIDPLDSPLETIPWSMWLTVYYLGIFAFAEAAFVLMALKEYLIDLLHLSDVLLITGREPASERPAAGS
jgi:hypothetical protein